MSTLELFPCTDKPLFLDEDSSVRNHKHKGLLPQNWAQSVSGNIP